MGRKTLTSIKMLISQQVTSYLTNYSGLCKSRQLNNQ